jgi:hypothetical protein
VDLARVGVHFCGMAPGIGHSTEFGRSREENKGSEMEPRKKSCLATSFLLLK